MEPHLCADQTRVGTLETELERRILRAQLIKIPIWSFSIGSSGTMPKAGNEMTSVPTV